MFHPCFTQLYPCLALLHILKSCTPVSPLTPLIPVTQSSPFYDHDIPCNALSHPLSPCYTPVSPCYAPPLHRYTPFRPFLHTYYTPHPCHPRHPPGLKEKKLMRKKNVLIKMILNGFSFVPSSTTWFLFCFDNINLALVCSCINNMSFVLFQRQQHGCQNWQRLVGWWEVAWLLESLRESSILHTLGSHQSSLTTMSDWLTRQSNDRTGFDKKYCFRDLPILQSEMSSMLV